MVTTARPGITAAADLSGATGRKMYQTDESFRTACAHKNTETHMQFQPSTINLNLEFAEVSKAKTQGHLHKKCWSVRNLDGSTKNSTSTYELTSKTRATPSRAETTLWRNNLQEQRQHSFIHLFIKTTFMMQIRSTSSIEENFQGRSDFKVVLICATKFWYYI